MSDLTRRQLLTRAAGAGFLIAAGGAGLSACGGSSGGAAAAVKPGGSASAKELEKLNAMMPFPLYLAFLADVAAASGGFMTDAGVDMNLQFARSAPQALQALLGGSVDVVRNAVLSTITTAQKQGADLIMIGMPVQDAIYQVVTTKDRPVGSLEELKGTTVGLPSLAGNAEQILDIVLRSKGMDPGSVKRVAVGNEAAAFTFVQQKKVRALWATVEATAGMTLAYPDQVDMLKIDGINPLLGQALVVKRTTFEQRREALTDYLSGLAKAMRAVMDDSKLKELAPAIRKDWELPQLDNLDKALPVVHAVTDRWTTAGADNLLKIVPERWNAGIEGFRKLGLVDASGDLDKLYTNELVDKATA